MISLRIAFRFTNICTNLLKISGNRSITHSLANLKEEEEKDDVGCVACDGSHFLSGVMVYVVRFELIRFNFTQHLSGKY